MIDDNLYQDNGFANREQYLQNLALIYEVDYYDVVKPLSEQFGPDGDFSELIDALDEII